VFSGSPNPRSRLVSTLGTPLLVTVVAVMIYTLFFGWGLLSGRIPPERAYVLLAVLCLIPAVWYLVGFLRHENNDFGLVLSSLGWFLAALLLFWRHLATRAALAQGLRFDQVPDSAASWIFALLCLAAIIGGAVLSGRYWLAKNAA